MLWSAAYDAGVRRPRWKAPRAPAVEAIAPEIAKAISRARVGSMPNACAPASLARSAMSTRPSRERRRPSTTRQVATRPVRAT